MAKEKEEVPESPSPSVRPPFPLPPSAGSRWKESIMLPSIVAGLVGAGVGMVSKHRRVQGIGNIPAMYATNFAVVVGCYCGSREFIRQTRASKPDDLLNSVAGGIMSGALLGRLQGGQPGAIRYSILFAAAGTTVDFAMLRLKPVLEQYNESFSKELKKLSDGKMPEWSPIQILDEEALAKKRAREQQLYAQRLGKLSKEES